MLNQNKIILGDLTNPLEGEIASYKVGDKSKRLTIGLHLNLKTGKVEGYKFFVYQGVNTVLGAETLSLALDKYNAIKIEPEVIVNELPEREVNELFSSHGMDLL